LRHINWIFKLIQLNFCVKRLNICSCLFLSFLKSEGAPIFQKVQKTHQNARRLDVLRELRYIMRTYRC